MELPTPDRILRPQVALAIETLQLANAALAELLEELAGIPIENQHPTDCFEILGWRATIKLFASLLAVEPGLPPIVRAIRECVARRNSPLERAETALNFAVSAIEEAVDTLDRIEDGQPFYTPLSAAYSVFGDMHARLASLIGSPGAGVGPELWRFSEN